MKIVIIDDERDILEGLQSYLKSNHFEVDIFLSGKDFLQQKNISTYDLIILDVMMPDIDGLEVCRNLRKKTNTPIIFLSAAGESFDRILGIEMGADDYITKPFNPREVLVRIKSILRRCDTIQDSISEYITTPFWKIDTQFRSIIYLSGKKQSFTAALYQMFEYLYKNKSQLVCRERVYIDLLRRDFEEFDRTIDIRVSRLRKMLDVRPENQSYIKTVKGYGYILDLDDEYTTS